MCRRVGVRACQETGGQVYEQMSRRVNRYIGCLGGWADHFDSGHTFGRWVGRQEGGHVCKCMVGCAGVWAGGRLGRVCIW
jgi:hypothetical protein